MVNLRTRREEGLLTGRAGQTTTEEEGSKREAEAAHAGGGDGRDAGLVARYTYEICE